MTGGNVKAYQDSSLPEYDQVGPNGSIRALGATNCARLAEPGKDGDALAAAPA